MPRGKWVFGDFAGGFWARLLPSDLEIAPLADTAESVLFFRPTCSSAVIGLLGFVRDNL